LQNKNVGWSAGKTRRWRSVAQLGTRLDGLKAKPGLGAEFAAWREPCYPLLQGVFVIGQASSKPSCASGVEATTHGGNSRWLGVEEFFLQRSAERAVAVGRALEMRRNARASLEHAVQTMRAAERLDPGELRSQWARQSVLELVEAYALSVSRVAPESRDREPFSREDALSAVANLPGAQRHASTIEALRDSRTDAPSPRRECEQFAELFAWLERHVEVRTEREVRLSRWQRCGALVLACAGVLWALTSAKNVAHGKPVSASSICGYTPPSPLGSPNLDRVVDGRRREASFAVCTEVEKKPWVAVDLGQSHTLTEVVVYPRTDCCFGELELPIGIEVSNDNQHFEFVDKKSIPATTDTPWRFALGGRSARYVRVSTDSKEPSQVVISEVEIYE
jgi:hypothetical protein